MYLQAHTQFSNIKEPKIGTEDCKMKRYLVKVTETRENELNEFIIIKEGYAYDVKHLQTAKNYGWSRKYFADRYVEKDMEWYKRNPDNWTRTWEVLEFDC